MHSISQQARMLGSWKEIASYLGKGVRTVQRWERQFGLPVRRPNVNAKGVVCALPQELDAWFAVQWGQRASPAAAPPNGKGPEIMHAGLQVAFKLRHANHQLAQELTGLVRGLHEECEALASCSTRFSQSSRVEVATPPVTGHLPTNSSSNE